MPHLTLRGATTAYIAEMRAAAHQLGMTLPAAIMHLSAAGWRTLQERRKGGRARAAAMTPEARSETARAAVAAREAKRREAAQES